MYVCKMIHIHSLLFFTLVAWCSVCSGDSLRKRFFKWERNLGQHHQYELGEFRYEVLVEEDIEEGGPDDNDKINDEDLICVETTLARYFNDNAQGYKEYSEDLLAPPEAESAEVEKVAYKPENGKDDEVTLSVSQVVDKTTNEVLGVGKIVVRQIGGVVVYRTTVRLSESDTPASTRLRRKLQNEKRKKRNRKKKNNTQNNTGNQDSTVSAQKNAGAQEHGEVKKATDVAKATDPQKKKNRKKKRKIWNATMRITAKCNFCLSDNLDYDKREGRAMLSNRKMEEKIDFSTWMNLRFQEQITGECFGLPETTFASQFWYTKDGDESSAPPPLTPADEGVVSALVDRSPKPAPANPVPSKPDMANMTLASQGTPPPTSSNNMATTPPTPPSPPTLAPSGPSKALANLASPKPVMPNTAQAPLDTSPSPSPLPTNNLATAPPNPPVSPKPAPVGPIPSKQSVPKPSKAPSKARKTSWSASSSGSRRV